MKLLRGAAAIAAGYAVFLLAIRVFAPATSGLNYFLWSVTGTVLGALAGGFLAALIAGRYELPFAAGLGFLMIGMSLISMRREGITHPGWYQTAIAGCGPMAAMVGAALRLLTK